MGMKYLDTKKDSLEEAVSKAMNGDNKPSADTLVAEGGKYLKYSDLLLQKGRLMAKNQSTAMIDKEIKKEMGKLGIKEKLDPVGKSDGDIDNDGDKDSSDKYLAKRRKAISKAIAKDNKEETNLEEQNIKIVFDMIPDKDFDNFVKRNKLKTKQLSDGPNTGEVEVTGDKRAIEKLLKLKGEKLSDYKMDSRTKSYMYDEVDLEAKTTKNVDETLDRIREANVEKGRSMREILADIWNMGEGKNVFDLEEAASVFISSFEKGDANMKDSKKYTDAIKKYGLKSNFVSTASKNGHEVTGRNINDITKFLSDFFGKDEFKDRFKKKGNSYEDMDEGFSSDAQRKAAFASGYKEKDKKESKTATGEKPTKVELDPKVK